MNSIEDKKEFLSNIKEIYMESTVFNNSISITFLCIISIILMILYDVIFKSSPNILILEILTSGIVISFLIATIYPIYHKYNSEKRKIE